MTFTLKQAAHGASLPRVSRYIPRPTCVVCDKRIPVNRSGYFCSDTCDSTELTSRMAHKLVKGLRHAVRRWFENPLK